MYRKLFFVIVLCSIEESQSRSGCQRAIAPFYYFKYSIKNIFIFIESLEHINGCSRLRCRRSPLPNIRFHKISVPIWITLAKHNFVLFISIFHIDRFGIIKLGDGEWMGKKKKIPVPGGRRNPFLDWHMRIMRTVQ